MVHLLPHWNWEEGEQIEVWAYTNAKSVELFINGKSQGIRNFETKYTSYGLEYRETEDGKLWLDWDTVFEAGELKR